MSKKETLNILMISPYFIQQGAGEKYAYEIAKRLVERGHNVTVLCSHRQKKDEEEIIDGIRVIRLKPDFILSSTPVRLDLFFKLLNLMKRDNFDLVSINFHLPYYADLAAMASKICKLPSILTYHNDLGKREPLLHFIISVYNHSVNRLTLSLTDKIITPSPYCYRESKLLKRFKDKVVWIPPGVDTQKYNIGNSFRIHDTYNLPHSSKIVLFVGEMSKAHTHKGVDYLLKSFKTVVDNVADAFLVLVGRGDKIPEYKDLCQQYGISSSVIFTGFIDEEELIEYYQSCNLVVLPSVTTQEGFGRTLLEGNACGKPVIGTEIGGIKHVIKHGENGLLVPPRDSVALANAIIYLLQNEEVSNKICINARKWVEDYSWGKIVARIETTCEEVTKR